MSSGFKVPAKKIDSQQWTLRFKQHKTTILLFVDQSQSFTSIKQDLLEAIQSTGLSELNGHSLPSSPDDVILGVPVDKHDLDRGWVNILIPEDDSDDEDDTKKSKKVKKDSVINSCPLGAGLRDGAMVAFRFKKADEDEGDKEAFDVIMPTYDEGSQDQALT